MYKNGYWRAFHFGTDTEVFGKKTGLDPIPCRALWPQATFHFSRTRLICRQNSLWSLNLLRFELKPIGASLAFPHRSTAKPPDANGEWALNQLHFAGCRRRRSHIGSDTPNPLPAAKLTVDGF